MNINLRSMIALAVVGPLSAFTIGSTLIAGPAAPASVLGLALLAVYGVLEIAALSYRPPRRRLTVPARRSAASAVSVRSDDDWREAA